MKTALRLVLAVAGLILFAVFIHRAGIGEISRAFSALGWLTPIVLLPFAVVYLLDTLGWRFAFGRTGAGVSYPTLLRIRWAGESVNSIVPSAYIAGEAVKVHLLRKRGVPAVEAASSVLAGKTAQTLAQVIFIALGALAASANLPADSPARMGMLVITMGATAVLVMLLWLQRRGIFAMLVAMGAKLRMRIGSERAESLRRLDERILNFYRTDRRYFVLSTGFYFSGWLCDTLEILLVSHLLGMPLDWTQAIAVEAFIGVAKGLGMFVPGALGVQESSVVFLFYLFGLPPALGVTYAIIRRGRDLIYAAAGYGVLHLEHLPRRVRGRDDNLRPPLVPTQLL